jgi:hypothetical protein
MEYLFDLERAVEAVEAPVPFGKFGMKVLLSFGVLYFLLVLSRSLALEFFWPLVQFAILNAHNGDGLLRASPRLAATVLPWVLALVVLALATFGIHRVLSKIYFQLKGLEAVIDRYQAIFWKPLGSAEKKSLAEKFRELGRHRVLLTAIETTDCIELARDLRECFEEASWQVANVPLSVGQVGIASSGLILWLRKGSDVFNKTVLDALLAATRGPITSLVYEKEDDAPDVQIVLGSRRPTND